jgi:hypothetical protein
VTSASSGAGGEASRRMKSLHRIATEQPGRILDWVGGVRRPGVADTHSFPVIHASSSSRRLRDVVNFLNALRSKSE